MRGKPEDENEDEKKERITPADAGKTMKYSAISLCK